MHHIVLDDAKVLLLGAREVTSNVWFRNGPRKISDCSSNNPAEKLTFHHHETLRRQTDCTGMEAHLTTCGKSFNASSNGG